MNRRTRRQNSGSERDEHAESDEFVWIEHPNVHDHVEISTSSHKIVQPTSGTMPAARHMQSNIKPNVIVASNNPHFDHLMDRDALMLCRKVWYAFVRCTWRVVSSDTFSMFVLGLAAFMAFSFLWWITFADYMIGIAPVFVLGVGTLYAVQYDIRCYPAVIMLMMTGIFLALFILLFTIVFVCGFGSTSISRYYFPAYRHPGYYPEAALMATIGISVVSVYKLVKIVSRAASITVLFIAAVLDVLLMYLLMRHSTGRIIDSRW